ncbi:uncharacterized protein PHACADRAFT_203857 [Phanerochaete carnosa HHB-10118-sp]|uniref:SprT-like domain-containing protein n=1 Tax=Phanerochaete carnosa (strain HHB-10118-sp) TaxID=650164 RepID=K5XCI8_PHACS|nr:uncharacterized protein PHACADRAFT_203857 [Phanerochaete carnosa HHB-10118-sp]EKM60707.1 hypothetical protein PHACADRAFT_203857 [Phanerochaete carnosa HHB-10118-sp]
MLADVGADRTPRKVVKATPVRPVSPKFALSKKDILKPEVARTKPLGSFRSAEGSSTTETANRASFTRPSLAAASELEKDTSSSEQREYEAAPSQSPVKASHDDIIDLTLSSSESGDSDSEADKREVTSLIYSSPPLSKLSNGVALPSLDRLSLKGESTPRKPVSRRVFDSEGKLNVGPALRPAPEASRRRWMERSPESEDDAPQTAAPIFQPRSLQTLPLRRTPSPQLSPPTSPAKKGKASRVTKKAQREAERTRREAYAEELFKELNASVFNGGLPETTALTWSVRLLTTAGRAKWRRSRDGTQTTEIELATKILDSDDRIRNTLSHEMCHLACWIIDGDPKEGHGRAFKAWAARVTRKRPDITVSTTHSYKIDYPYEWECDYCSKVYGRHSKSIKIEELRDMQNGQACPPVYDPGP